ncbi:hypothetical protein COK19_04035 [Bacillus cereus]|uniref:hypothetical protein n=1 Tax=Bacillus cereus TaxID=1396 RepID=UPI000BF94D18|nr:hypothetical protein [Bacillus cereus]PFR30838.1 hypothetical protein COK19_04035 [Bacillus cereus]
MKKNTYYNHLAIDSSINSFTLKVSRLALYFIYLVYISMLLAGMGLPGIIKFAHFFLIFLMLLILIYGRSSKQGRIILILNLLLFLTIFISMFINKAGGANLLLGFLLLAEPFLFLYILINRKWAISSIIGFNKGIFILVVLNTLLAVGQFLVVGEAGDDVKGFFVNMGAGHHIAGSVSLTAAIYYYFNYPYKSKFIKNLCVISFSLIVILTDSKQSLLIFLISLFIFMIFKINNIKKFFSILITAIIFITSLYVMAISVFPALMAWANMDLVLEGLEQKFSVFNIFSSHQDSILNVLFGFGPGHTVTRLGWLIPEYYSILQVLGVTVSPMTELIFQAQQGHWISNSITGSSIWSLLFSWAGIWGDIGLVGTMIYLIIYLYLMILFRNNTLCLFMLITMMVHGMIFAWLEEPGYMLFMVCLLGLEFQKNTIN